MIGVLIVIFPGDFTIVKRLVSYNLSGKSTSTSPYEESNIQGLLECMEAPLNQTEMDVFFVVFFVRNLHWQLQPVDTWRRSRLLTPQSNVLKGLFFFFFTTGNLQTVSNASKPTDRLVKPQCVITAHHVIKVQIVITLSFHFVIK